MGVAWGQTFPKLYEIFCESDQENISNYFHTFDDALKNPIAQRYYKLLEGDLEKLDPNAWQQLKKKVLPYINKKHKQRAYEQFFDFINEAKGYLYLKLQGCTEIRFIPEKSIKAGIKTPDLVGCCDKCKVLLEVKTIHISKEELIWELGNSTQGGHMCAKPVRLGIGDGLKNKIESDIQNAKKQLNSYACDTVQRMIIYMIINLDILAAANYYNVDALKTYFSKRNDGKFEVVYSFISIFN